MTLLNSYLSNKINIMRIPKILFVITAVITLFSFQSCNKSSDTTPSPTAPPSPPVTTSTDTLTTGWSKIVLAGEQLSDIFFNSSTTGYLVGSKVYKSIDGGNTWTPVLSTGGLFNIFMTNDSKAFFAGEPNNIFRTSDGGSSFTNISIGGVPLDIFFIDNNNGFSVTTNGLYSTVDGGLTWVHQNTTGLPVSGSIGSLSFVDNSTGWVIKDNAIYKTVGSYLTWQLATVTGGTASIYFSSIYSTSPTNIYAANVNGEIFRSTNGGINFSFVGSIGVGQFVDIHFLSDLVGYACTDKHVFKTTDGGVNWSKVVSLAQGNLIELHFTDANHGWVCGSDGTVLIFKQ